MRDLILPLLLGFNGAFSIFAYVAVNSRRTLTTPLFFGFFALANSILITYGAQTATLFDGRATSDQWWSGLFLPTTAFFSLFALYLATAASILAARIHSYFAFTAVFIVIGIISLFTAMTILALVFL